MPKSKTVFFCKECGNESSKWLGQCPFCKSWDSFVEEPKEKVLNKQKFASSNTALFNLNEVTTENDSRTLTNIQEFDRVLGGGIVDGSLVLVGGDPGIGKSTLLLQVCKELAQLGKKVLYISGEESPKQVKLRADRLGRFEKDILIQSETSLDNVEVVIEEQKPQIVIIDSIQTMYRDDITSAPGSVSQVRETTSTLLKIAKTKGITIFIIGHVTKEGVVAGPRVLEHMVDTVLYFEGENSSSYRILRAVKNRFGSTNEIGVFEMRQTGLKEILNPSEFMLAGMPEDEPGSVIAIPMEGTRPILVEVQALVCQSNLNIPRRTAAGTDYNRMNLLLAVMEKRLGIQLAFCDAYVNVAGGMKIAEPALDLALVLALLSSYKNTPLPSKTVAIGEVGLIGEIRAVGMIEQRVSEAIKMGYHSIILPLVNATYLQKNMKLDGIKLIGISNIKELTKVVFK